MACQTETSENGTGATSPVRKTQSQRRRWRRWKRCKALAQSQARLQHSLVEEDWEKEIKESLLNEDCEKETYNAVYDPEDELCLATRQVTLSHFQCESSDHIHYTPAVHHVSPVKWVQHVHRIVNDQFTDAEE